ncbi:unnamed protein product [Pseudo-nitzschia multistriata]|uniref:4-hydroxy-3-methylbut-2-enyl diphosphate reductase n=1 Tax=Pseudo-nitzschia multistriata TaxID=183589 RepID=A0A448ZLY0_9STRA|nr:unnamed protein product [Pseudo-nitzschia multistriata]
MRFPTATSIIHLLLAAQFTEAFQFGSRYLRNGRRTQPLFSTIDDQDSKPKAITKEKKIYIKNEREQIARKKDFYRGAGVFRDVKAEVTQDMKEQFDSDLMNKMKENPNYMIEKDGVEFYLAKDHGFCWGVERSINLAYSAVETFSESKVHITNELIHNPMVNDRLHTKDVNFIGKDEDNGKDFSQIEEGDVVMLPAFGATLEEMKELDAKKVKVVDTTCPWVAKVWNTVHTHQVRGLTSVIHGKYAHEETMATKSMCETYICVKNLEEAEYVSDFILTAKEGDGRAEKFMEKFSKACSSHFDPHRHLKKIGLANQTTMYKKETRAIGQLLQKTMMKTFGPDLINEHYYEFDTICDATQVRQDAVDELCNMHDDPEQVSLDFILVVGGFDSSNTAHLLEIPDARGVTSFHIDAAECVQAENKLKHRTVDGEITTRAPFLTEDMLWTTDADTGERTKKVLRVGVTSGASTPDKEVQDALGRIMMLNKLSEAGYKLKEEKEE